MRDSNGWGLWRRRNDLILADGLHVVDDPEPAVDSGHCQRHKEYDGWEGGLSHGGTGSADEGEFTDGGGSDCWVQNLLSEKSED